MKIRTATSLTTALALGLWAGSSYSATIAENLTFTAEDSLFGSAPVADFSVGPGSFGVSGIAEVHYDAQASSGTVEADLRTRLQAIHPDTLSFGHAASTPVNLSLEREFINLPGPLAPFALPLGIASFQTAFGADANVSVELFSAADVNLVGIGGIVETSATSVPAHDEPFNEQFSDSGEARIASKGAIECFLGVCGGAEVSVYLSQQSTLSFGDLVGTVEARHEDGTLVTQDFALDQSVDLFMNLQREGLWTLSLSSITVDNAEFSSDFGFRIGGEACAVFCADIKSGVLSFGSADVGLDFSERSMDLATILVTPEQFVVPVPAGLPLLLSGFGALAIVRRRRSANG